MTKQAVHPFHLIIPAAGTASRMGKNTPKPYLKINGKAILRHTIEKFININGLQSITVIINAEHQKLYDETVQGLDLQPPITGAKTRKSSVYNALNSFVKVGFDETILIHDAARPLIKRTDIIKLLQIMNNADAGTLASPITNTLHNEANNDAVDRDNLWSIQTPQAFKFGKLKEAHEKFKGNDDFTDDAGLMRAMGHKVELVPALHSNIKITTEEDFLMAQQLMTAERETRTAQGFDVHAFEKEKTDRPLMLGGIQIEHDYALTGHSDADVILHAATDALLGTINAGDIGTHFPPSESQWKDTDSSIFLKKAVEILQDNDATITFLDITVLAEEPKIGPHREKMQCRIAEILNISTKRISIKATTTEKLGFTGRKEGIACQALATITLPVTE